MRESSYGKNYYSERLGRWLTAPPSYKAMLEGLLVMESHDPTPVDPRPPVINSYIGVTSSFKEEICDYVLDFTAYNKHRVSYSIHPNDGVNIISSSDTNLRLTFANDNTYSVVATVYDTRNKLSATQTVNTVVTAKPEYKASITGASSSVQHDHANYTLIKDFDLKSVEWVVLGGTMESGSLTSCRVTWDKYGADSSVAALCVAQDGTVVETNVIHMSITAPTIVGVLNGPHSVIVGNEATFNLTHNSQNPVTVAYEACAEGEIQSSTDSQVVVKFTSEGDCHVDALITDTITGMVFKARASLHVDPRPAMAPVINSFTGPVESEQGVEAVYVLSATADNAFTTEYTSNDSAAVITDKSNTGCKVAFKTVGEKNINVKVTDSVSGLYSEAHVTVNVLAAQPPRFSVTSESSGWTDIPFTYGIVIESTNPCTISAVTWNGEIIETTPEKVVAKWPNPGTHQINIKATDDVTGLETTVIENPVINKAVEPVINSFTGPDPAYVNLDFTYILDVTTQNDHPYTVTYSPHNSDGRVVSFTNTSVVLNYTATGAQAILVEVVDDVTGAKYGQNFIFGIIGIPELNAYISGSTTVNNRPYDYTANSDSKDPLTYSWVVKSGGSIEGSTTGATAKVAWTDAGTHTLEVTVTNTVTSKVKVATLDVTVTVLAKQWAAVFDGATSKVEIPEWSGSGSWRMSAEIFVEEAPTNRYFTIVARSTDAYPKTNFVVLSASSIYGYHADGNGYGSGSESYTRGKWQSVNLNGRASSSVMYLGVENKETQIKMSRGSIYPKIDRIGSGHYDPNYIPFKGKMRNVKFTSPDATYIFEGDEQPSFKTKEGTYEATSVTGVTWEEVLTYYHTGNDHSEAGFVNGLHTGEDRLHTQNKHLPIGTTCFSLTNDASIRITEDHVNHSQKFERLSGTDEEIQSGFAYPQKFYVEEPVPVAKKKVTRKRKKKV